jgi:hypothetical protein
MLITRFAGRRFVTVIALDQRLRMIADSVGPNAPQRV